MYQILTESTEFCGRYDKNILVFFSVHSVCPYLAPFLRYSEIMVEKCRLEPTNLPHLYLAPLLGVIWLEFHGDFWHQKTRVPALSYSVVSMTLGLAVFVQLRVVTDGQTHDHS